MYIYTKGIDRIADIYIYHMARKFGDLVFREMGRKIKKPQV